MKYAKRLVVVFFLFFSSQFVFGQDVSEASETVKKIAKVGTDRWRNTLILTNKQTEKLLTLTTMYEMKKTKIYKSQDVSAEEQNNKLMALEKEHHKSIEAILSEKQKEKFRQKVTPIQG